MAKLSNKLIVRLILSSVVILVIAFLVFNENGILKYLSLKNQLHELDLQINSAEEKIRMLEAEIDSLINSKEKMEKVARERFHMMLPDERVLKIEEK
ncbi:MAG TPA: septum formation initiator family protein [Melioribacteraceae bacterium]|nr:septum formation initiator family protein [Melioribacteraceae bacterium]